MGVHQAILEFSTNNRIAARFPFVYSSPFRGWLQDNRQPFL
jgi:hypothetical protein